MEIVFQGWTFFRKCLEGLGEGSPHRQGEGVRFVFTNSSETAKTLPRGTTGEITRISEN